MQHVAVVAGRGGATSDTVTGSVVQWFPIWGSGPSKGSQDKSEATQDDEWKRNLNMPNTWSGVQSLYSSYLRLFQLHPVNHLELPLYINKLALP